MTVKELIEELRKLPNQDARVMISDSEYGDDDLNTVHVTKDGDEVHLV